MIINLLCLLTFLQVCSSNLGTDFLLAFPQNRVDDDLDIIIIITPVDENIKEVDVRLWDPDENHIKNLTLLNGKPAVITVAKEMKMPVGSSVQSNHTMTVKATHLVTVVVRNVGKSNFETFTTLPVPELGREYFIFSYQPQSGKKLENKAASFVVIASNEDFNKVTLKLPALSISSDLFLLFDGIYYGSNDVINVTLDKYQSLQLQALFDLTGTHIVSTAPIGVWAGLNRTTMNTCFSHVCEMHPPVQKYGLQFVLVPVPKPLSSQLFRILAREADTSVDVYSNEATSNQTYYLSHPGSFVEISLTDSKCYMFANSSKPVAVASYVSGKTVDEKEEGDATMTILAPVGSVHRSKYRLYLHMWKKNYVHLTFIISKKNDMELNGVTVSNQTVTRFLDGNFESYDISGPNDLMAGVISLKLRSNASNETYILQQPAGKEFMLYAAYVRKCQGESFAVAFSEETIAMPLQTAEVKCCYPLDINNQTYLDGACSKDMVAGFLGGNRCCVKDNVKVKCAVENVSHHCKKIPYQRFSSTSQLWTTLSSVSCLNLCTETSGCIGVNYNRTGEDGGNCELLFGEFNGFVDSTSLKFLACSSLVSSKIL